MMQMQLREQFKYKLLFSTGLLIYKKAPALSYQIMLPGVVALRVLIFFNPENP
jgi:hypothetical protein